MNDKVTIEVYGQLPVSIQPKPGREGECTGGRHLIAKAARQNCQVNIDSVILLHYQGPYCLDELG